MSIEVVNRQRKVRLDLKWLRAAAAQAAEACAPLKGTHGPHLLETLEEVDAAVISDAAIAGVHRDFMNLEGPTDVITFYHGELLVSAETAAAQAPRFGHTVEQELALYIIHGLLHLNGFNDLEPGAHAEMHRVQAEVLRDVIGRVRERDVT